MDSYITETLVEDLVEIPDLNISLLPPPKEQLIIKIPTSVVQQVLQEEKQFFKKEYFDVQFFDCITPVVQTRKLFHCAVFGCHFNSVSKGAVTRHERRHLNPYFCYCGMDFCTIQEYMQHKH